MTIEQFIKIYAVDLYLNRDAALWRPNRKSIADAGAPNVDIGGLLFVAGGRLDIRILNRTYIMTSNCFVEVTGFMNSIQFLSASDDLDAYFLAFTYDFHSRIFNNHPPFSADYVDYFFKNPLLQLHEEMGGTLRDAFRSLEHSFSDRNNTYREQLIGNKIINIYYEMTNYLSSIALLEEDDSALSDRKRAIFKGFMSILKENALKEHTVEFYANKLCITPQYLGRIIHEFHRKSAYEMICECIVSEIKILLADKSVPLLDIVDKSHFSDQSSFTKFFRRHTNMTPLQYRNSI